MNKLVIGNLKMNLSDLQERERYFALFKKAMNGEALDNTEIVLCPPQVHLEAFLKSFRREVHPVEYAEKRRPPKAEFNRVKIGAQNAFWENKGSFTGEISMAMVKNLGGEYVILGHSERRRYFCENNAEINLKVLAALKVGLKPVICIGETKLEKESGQTLGIVSKQLKETLANISRSKAENIVIAYEPVWAVGSDLTPTSHEIMEAKVLIRKILAEMFGKKYASLVKIVYGGSVSSKTAVEVCVDPGMDGVLVGRESLMPHEFLKIAEIINK